MKKEKVISVFLVLAVLIVFLSSCAKDNAETPDNSTTESTTNSTMDTIVEESLYQKLIRIIDGNFQKDYYEAISTIEMVETCDKYAAKWDYIANECYNAIMAYDKEDIEMTGYPTTEEFKQTVTNMKADWEAYYISNCEDYRTTLHFTYGPGTIVGPVFAHHQYELKMEWALQLVDICQMVFIEDTLELNLEDLG